MACLGRSQEDLRFSGPLGLVHRTQQHPVPSVFCFCFFCQSQRGFCCHFKGRTVDFFSGVGYCCVGVSLVVQSRSHSVAAVCRILSRVAWHQTLLCLHRGQDPRENHHTGCNSVDKKCLDRSMEKRLFSGYRDLGDKKGTDCS